MDFENQNKYRKTSQTFKIWIYTDLEVKISSAYFRLQEVSIERLFKESSEQNTEMHHRPTLKFEADIKNIK